MICSPVRFEDWPAADAEVWHALVRSGDVLTGSGPRAHWRPSTRFILVRDYGYWLAHLKRIGVPLAEEAPMSGISRERVQSYVVATAHLAFSLAQEGLEHFW